MICPRCGSKTVTERGGSMYTSFPPQWDEQERCYGCGYASGMRRVRGKTEEEGRVSEWKRINGIE